MTDISNRYLIDQALSVVNPKKIGDSLIGDVGCALLTNQGNVYCGVAIDVGSGIGFCAEHSAIAAMITAGEFKIKKIVAVWTDDHSEYVLAPCGRCREFMRQIHEDNWSTTEVIIGVDKTVMLSELLPYDQNGFIRIENQTT